MSIRMPLSIQTRQMLLGLQRTQDRMATNTQRISTGSRITTPADDPAGAALVVDLGTSIDANTQYQTQVDSALSFLQDTETALGAVSDSVSQLLELGTQGLGETTNPAGRAAIAYQVDGLRSTLAGLANTQAQGKYLFSGTKTTTQPFVLPTNGTATYNGNSVTYSLDVSNSDAIGMNLPGDQVFQGSGGAGSATDLFQAVTDLRDGLRADNTAQIQTAYDHLKGILDTVTQAQTDIGGRVSRMNDLKSNLSAQNLSLQSMQNGVQDTNYPEAITNYTTDQVVQSATLSALGRTNQPNLFNYLG